MRRSLSSETTTQAPEFSADADQLTQAILNIVRNAWEASKADCQITIKTRSRRQYTLNGHRHKLVCAIDIIDNGPGIPNDLMSSFSCPWSPRDPRAQVLAYPSHNSHSPATAALSKRSVSQGIPASRCWYQWKNCMTDSNEIWVVDDDSSIRWVIEKALSGEDISCKASTAPMTYSGTQNSDTQGDYQRYSYAWYGRFSPLGELKSIIPDVPVIITTAHSDLDSAVTS